MASLLLWKGYTKMTTKELKEHRCTGEGKVTEAGGLMLLLLERRQPVREAPCRCGRGQLGAIGRKEAGLAEYKPKASVEQAV